MLAKDSSDWVWWDENVPKKLSEIHENGFKIVIFSNQAGVEIGRIDPIGLQQKFTQLYEILKISFQAICATSKDANHKPSIGMWKYFVSNCNDGIEPDKSQSFYCGDSAGRPKRKDKKKDFSYCDRQFAMNLGVQFYTPEMYFQDLEEIFPPLEFDINTLKSLKGQSSTEEEKKYTSEAQEVVVFVGAPGSGKSTFWKNYLKDYVRVNNEILKTKQKCIEAARKILKEGKSCVVDNTNPKIETRSDYISIAEEFKVPCRAFYYNTDKNICMHNNEQRSINPNRNHLSKKTPRLIINVFFKNCVVPTQSEGFTEVKVINFIPGPFESDDDKETYYLY
ncbi:unnamed protein product [Moneuplotes crassus]|uniref:Bifunctional polynucleotide phosphatase/kinase n=1 Tax=Euplotes crassus TaxID=5936 RepID=A0AAD1UFG3_EUPCR|nr:unnamed protein product [Moneuplotes crassus]